MTIDRSARRPWPAWILTGLALGLAFRSPGVAAKTESPIRDNSFLIEEAYNQDPGVVQSIQSLQRTSSSGEWIYSFTQEWPAGGPRHQVSYTFNWAHAAIENGAHSGFGDLALHYRYQLLGGPESNVSISPRFSLLLPTGSAREALGSGGFGLQVSLPLSVVLAPRWVAHSNVGYTFIRRGADPAGDRADLYIPNLGQSVVWLVSRRVNLMLEAVWLGGENVVGERRVDHANDCFVSPGLRWSHDFPSGMQIVPGLAVPIGVGPSHGNRSILLYLSIEHPFH